MGQIIARAYCMKHIALHCMKICCRILYTRPSVGQIIARAYCMKHNSPCLLHARIIKYAAGYCTLGLQWDR